MVDGKHFPLGEHIHFFFPPKQIKNKQNYITDTFLGNVLVLQSLQFKATEVNPTEAFCLQEAR